MKQNRIISRGPFKGKKIEFASNAGIHKFKEISEDLMRRIFSLEPEDYLITDESSLFDFTGVDDMELEDIQKKIWKLYNLDVTLSPSGNLLEIFKRIRSTNAS